MGDSPGTLSQHEKRTQNLVLQLEGKITMDMFSRM